MKEFEKSWKSHSSDRVDKHGIGIVDDPDYKDYYYSGWEAALEMVSKKCDELDDVCCLDCGCFGMVVNKIDEELEGE